MSSRSLWLIVKQHSSELEIFTIGSSVLPVFSFREEAEVFLHLRDAGDGWQTRETTYGELTSVLSGPCRDVEHVSLGPVPEIVEPVGLSREAFVEALLTSDTSSALEEAYILAVASQAKPFQREVSGASRGI